MTKPLQSREEQWALLHHYLAREGRTTEVAPGRFEVVVDEGADVQQTVTVVITPDEWAEVLLHDHPDLDILFADTFGPLDDDERFVVHHKGRLERSVREELPPVRGRATERLMREITSE